MLRYYFNHVSHCEMCGDNTESHKVIGQRLNQSQGLHPKKKSGISVSVKKCTNCSLIYSSPQPIPFDIQDHYGTPPENFFDFITFGAVLEHLYHPAACLEKALQWLKPEGILQVEVPSSKHLVSKLINIYFTLIGTNFVTNISPMHAPFHMYEFSLKS